MPYNWRALLAFAHDILAVAVAWILAFSLRFNLELPDPYFALALKSVLLVVSLQALIFWAFGLYRGVWRYASLPDLQRIILATAFGTLASTAILFILKLLIPLSVFVISPALLILIMGGSRLAYRSWKEQRFGALIPAAQEPVFVLGASEAAANLIKDLARSPQWRVIGVFDDDRTHHGRQIHGAPVFGAIADLSAAQRRLNVRHAIIAMPESDHSARRRALEIARDIGLQVLTVPSFDDLMSGRVTISQIRNIELDDLLGRDPVKLDNAGLQEWLGGRVALVTGAGGSIGAELCRQIASYRPERIVMLDHSEFSLYTVEQEFSRHFPDTVISTIIGDVKDRFRIEQVLSMFRPSVVFHAAAYKHVPLMEKENAWQAVLNNIQGTRVVAEAAIAFGVEKFVLISTDKAVNPTNVMGATKRLAEMLCKSLQKPWGTRFVIVRFGNVLGSSGSVIPKFHEQIAAGGPVTVTHPEITRFFMSIPEAVQLVMQAGLMGNGGEIFVLDMGEQVKIADIALEMIRLSGFDKDDIQITYIGLRPGEKLYEELLNSNEKLVPTPHPKLQIAIAFTPAPDFENDLLPWLAQAKIPEDSEVYSQLKKLLTKYHQS